MSFSLGNSSDEGANEEDFDMSPYSFDDLLDTPDREEIEKELSGKKTEVLVNIVVSHPNSMKDTILDHSTRMLRLRERVTQKSDALSKLTTVNDDGESYVPGSLRIKNPIEAPGYYKDNDKLKEIVEEGNRQNEEDKKKKVAIVRKMTQAVKELSEKECQKEIFSAIEALSLDLVTSWKTSSNDRLDIKLNRKEHALLAAELFMMSEAAAGLIASW